MDHCIEHGELPVFGYPTVCFSPVGGAAGAGDKERKERFWQRLYQQTIRNKKEGHRSSIVKCLDTYDEFHRRQQVLLKDFAKGRYKANNQVMSQTFTRAAHAKRDYDPGDPYAETGGEQQQSASKVAF